MLRLTVNLEDAAARDTLARLRGRLEDRTDLHEAMAEGAGELVRNHLLDRNTRSPNTGYYGKAARSVETSADGIAARIRIPQAGMALRYYGGRVTAGKSTSSATGQPTKNLAVPTPHVPVRNGERLRPGEMRDLAFIPNRKGGVSVTTGYLVEGIAKRITKGPNKGKERIVPAPNGRRFFALRGWTDHQPDPGVLPTESELTTAAVDAAVGYLAAIDRGPQA